MRDFLKIEETIKSKLISDKDKQVFKIKTGK